MWLDVTRNRKSIHNLTYFKPTFNKTTYYQKPNTKQPSNEKFKIDKPFNANKAEQFKTSN